MKRRERAISKGNIITFHTSSWSTVGEEGGREEEEEDEEGGRENGGAEEHLKVITGP